MFEHLLRFDKSKTIVLWDFETLNLCLHACHNLPWQLAMMKVKGNDIVDFKDYLIKWDTKLTISDGAARITRYSQDKMDKFGLPPEEVYPVMKQWFDEADFLMGHNVIGFDIHLVFHWCRMNGDDPRPYVKKLIDTNLLAKGLKLEVPLKTTDNLLEYQYKLYHKKVKGVRTNLTALGKEYEIEHDYDNLHNARVDLELNKKVWDKLKFQIEI